MMDFSWLLKSLCSKDEFYIFLVSLTVALSCEYFNISDIPWLLMLLYSFLILSFIRFVWTYCNAKHKKAQAKAQKVRKIAEEQAEYSRLIEIHFIGMDVKHKMEALEVIDELPTLPNFPYTFISKEPFKYGITHYYESFNNPFNVSVNGSYIQLVTTTKQQDYCTITFNNAQFFNLIKENAERIREDFMKKYPELYNQIIRIRGNIYARN